MQYVGGKFRIRKELAAFLESQRRGRIFIEPFCGGANITAEISEQRIAFDLCPDVVFLWSEAAKGWRPPTQISEEEYEQAKTAPSSALRGFIGFGCSFGGKFFGGYARSGERNYALNAHNSVIKKAKSLQGVRFGCGDYRSLEPNDALVYCDPPYKDTTQGYVSSSFDSDAFWCTMQKWAMFNTVLVSEYTAPLECTKVVWSVHTKTDMHTKTGKAPREEKVFQVLPF